MARQYIANFENGDAGFVNYRNKGGVLHLIHSEVPSHLRGGGYGGALMSAVLDAIEKDGFKVQPVCHYTAHYLKRNTQWHHLLA